MQSKMRSKLFNLSTLKILTTEEKKDKSFHTDHRAHTNEKFPKSSCKQSNAKCTMHVFSFPFLNVDGLQKESGYITLISI